MLAHSRYILPISKKDMAVYGAYAEGGRAVNPNDPGYWGEAIEWRRRLDAAKRMVEQHLTNLRLWRDYLNVLADAASVAISPAQYGLAHDVAPPYRNGSFRTMKISSHGRSSTPVGDRRAIRAAIWTRD